MQNISVLHIDLGKKEYSTKSYVDLKPFVGGVGIASKLLLDFFEKDPVILAVGPLNGFFPYASKTCAAFVSDGSFVDTYVGGRLSTRLRFCGIDAVVFEGKSEKPILVSITDREVDFFSEDTDISTLGVPGQRSVCEFTEDSLKIGGYFSFGDEGFSKKLLKANLKGFVVSSTEAIKLDSKDKYEALYNELLGAKEQMLVSPSDNPSCSGCPMGCDKSKKGENGGNVLVHSLVACTYAEPIYGDVSRTFSCLNVLGYDYTHEDLEALPNLVYSNITKIYEKIGSRKLETK